MSVDDDDFVDRHNQDGFPHRPIDREESTSVDLSPISPEEAVSWYLNRRRNELADSSLYTHRSSLNHFIRWAEQVGLDNLNELDGRKLQEYLHWRIEEAPSSVDQLAPKSVKTQYDITRKFIQYCEAINGVVRGLHERVLPFRVKEADEVRDEMLEMDRTEEILAHLETYHYASRDHVIWTILAETGARIGALRSLDVEDFDPDERVLRFRYRPETGTSLKNDRSSERLVALIRDGSVKAIQAYIDAQRTEGTDDYGRRPLLTTRNGRIGSSTVRKSVYRWSCPTAIGEDCDHEKTMTAADAWRCSNNACPHMIRRGVITHLLRNDVPVTFVSDRCDVSPGVIKLHYDARSEEERMTTRRQMIEKRLNLDQEGRR